jgi:hypothetical protein
MLLPIKRDILYKNHTIAIQILSQTLAETTDQKEPYFVISIVPWNCDEAKIKESENLKDILRLSFDDTETEKNAISSEQAEKIKDFALGMRYLRGWDSKMLMSTHVHSCFWPNP